MSGVYRAPITPGMRWSAGNGISTPAAAYQLFQYLAGSVTKQATFTDATGNTQNANPILLDANGSLEAAGPGGTAIDLWLSGGVAYKLELQSPTGAIVWSKDNLVGVDDPAFAAGGVGEWLSGPALTWISSSATVGTVASCAGDQRPIYDLGRRVRITDANGPHYGTVSASSYVALGNLTTITVLMDGGVVVVNPITAAAYALLDSAAPSSPLDSAPAFVLPDADVTIGRGSPRTLQMTPSANRSVTLDNSFGNSDWRVIENKAAAFNIAAKANDGTTIVTIPGGASCAVRTRIAAPGTLTDWGALANFLLMRGGAAPSTPAAGTVTVGAVATDAFGVAKSALRVINEAGAAFEMGGYAARLIRTMGIDPVLSYADAGGVSGADATAQTVKTIVIPANYIGANGQGLAVIVFWKSSTATAIGVGTYLNAQLLDANLGANFSTGGFSLIFLIRESTTQAALGSMQATAGGAPSMTANPVHGLFDFTINQNLEVKQGSAVGTHITLYAVALLPIG